MRRAVEKRLDLGEEEMREVEAAAAALLTAMGAEGKGSQRRANPCMKTGRIIKIAGVSISY